MTTSTSDDTGNIDWDAMAEERLGQRPPGPAQSAVLTHEPVVWQARDIKHGGVWVHVPYPRGNPDFEYRPLYAALGTAGAVEAIPVAWHYLRATARTSGGKPALWQNELTFGKPDTHEFIKDVRPLYAAPSPAALDPVTVEAAGPSAEQLAVLVRYLESQSDRLTKALDNPNWTPRRSHAEGDRNAFLAAANTLDQALRASNADTSTDRVGEYRADYSPVTAEEIAKEDPELAQLDARSRPVPRCCICDETIPEERCDDCPVSQTGRGE